MIKLIVVLLFLTSCGKPIEEKKENSPKVDAYRGGISEEIILDTSMSLNFDLLPLQGSVRKRNRFWSGDSWRLKLGAINYRWNSPLKESFNYLSPSHRQILSYSVDQIKELSPAEKYDLLMGRYDYPLKYEVDFLARNGTEDWEGLCHGWAGATINHEEPEPKVMTNPDGIVIPFGSSDIKALLSYAYSKLLISENESLGKRCEALPGEEDEHCDEDLDPVTFHVVLTNKLGLRGQTLIADVDRYREVWNHPLHSYETRILKMVSFGEGRLARLETKVSYVDVTYKNSWEKHPPIMSFITFRYELDLDKNGNITKGKWLSRERPDFLWTISKAEAFEGYLSDVMKLIK